MKTRTKVILGLTGTLLLGLAGARAARQAKWEPWVAEQEYKFAQARLRQGKAASSVVAARADEGSAQDAANAHASHAETRHHAAPADATQGQQSHDDHANHGAATAAMSGHTHPNMEAHMRWSAPRAETPEDTARAGEIVATLRSSLERYMDYKAAIDDGYEPFLPNVKLPMYHFTNYRLAIADAFRFDPAKPSSLLYRKHATGYELIGVMYTAPRRFSEAQLDERVPLSIARWHQHVNICLPSGTPAERARADWTRFGPAGSIATESACKGANGRWQPVLFGWMVHVYPFKQSREEIWTH